MIDFVRSTSNVSFGTMGTRKLQIESIPGPLTPGKATMVRVSGVDPDVYKRVRLELRLLEHTTGLLAIGGPVPKLVANKTVSMGATTVDLGVPADLLPAYQGTIIGWDYELRLVGVKSGPDHVDTQPVQIAQSTISPKRSRVSLDIGSSQPLRLSRRIRDPGIDSGGGLWIALVTGVLAVGLGGTLPLILRTVEPDDEQVAKIIAWLLIIFFAFLSLSSFWSATFRKVRKLNQASLEVSTPRLRRGEGITVVVNTEGLNDLEIGVEYTEILGWERAKMAGDSAGQSNTTSKSHAMIERFQPAIDGSVVLPTLPDDPLTYAGDVVAVHCLVVLRSTRFKAGAGAISVVVHG